MFVRTATRRNKDGSAVRYVQLVQNEWDPATKSSRMRVVHSFGREDQLDRAAVERLAGSLGRLLGQDREAAGATPELAYSGSVAYGGTYLLDQLWQRLGIGQAMTAMLSGTRRDAATERVLFALVANRALDPSSKLAAAHWAGRKAHIDRLPATTDDACYRAMDWLHEVRHALERQVFSQVAAALDLEVDLLFFDTTSTYFEVDEEDGRVPRARQLQGPPRRPAPDRDRDGRHPQRDPGPGLVLAREHRRLQADPPGQGRHARLDALEDRLGRRPRVHLERQPPLPAPRRPSLHHRGEAPLRLRRGGGRAVPAGPLPGSHREPAGQGSPH